MSELATSDLTVILHAKRIKPKLSAEVNTEFNSYTIHTISWSESHGKKKLRGFLSVYTNDVYNYG